MHVAVVQQMAGTVYNYKETFENILFLIDEAGKNSADLTVLPECAYPAYFLGENIDLAKESLSLNDKLISKTADLARKYNMYIALGLVICRDEKFYNSAIFFNRNGEIINTANKSNFWHFDEKWFTPCEEYTTFETDFGTMGMMVCADGRIPEISRILALKGADVIIDLANLGAQAFEKKDLSNQQYQFLLSTRAKENGVWLIVADKVGLECGCANYLGRSMIIDPTGKIITSATTDKQEIIYATLETNSDYRKECISKRRPELYDTLIKPFDKVPLYDDLSIKLNMSDSEVLSAPVMFFPQSLEDYEKKSVQAIKRCELMGCKLVMLPQINGDVDNLSKLLLQHTPSNMVLIISARDKKNCKCAVAMWNGEEIGRWYKTHGERCRINPNAVLECIKSPVGKLAVIFDEEGEIPEVSRSHTLNGCNILLWSDSKVRDINQKTMQTRGAENKIFVMRNSCALGDWGAIADIEGRILCSSFIGEEQIPFAMIVYSLSLAKNILPGTNILYGRKEKSYSLLVKK